MRRFLATLAISGLGCTGPGAPAPDDDADADTDSDADADADTDADSDADTDADTDADSDADSDADADTGPPASTGETGIPAECDGLGEPVARLEPRDGSGPCATCVGDVRVAAVLANPCPFDIAVDLYLPEGLLVRDWLFVFPNGDGMEVAAYYYGPPTPVVIPASGQLEWEFQLSGVLGSLDPGTWQVQAWFVTVPTLEASATFDVP